MPYDTPYALPEDMEEHGLQTCEYQNPMPDDCNGSQQRLFLGSSTLMDSSYGHAESSALDSCRNNWSSGPIDGRNVPETPMYDFREYEPLYDIEVMEIEAALHRTRRCFEEAHPFNVAPPTTWLSYNGARAVLETRHRNLCEAQGQRVTPLVALGPWYHTLDSWPLASEI